MRTFIAINFDSKVKQYLHEAQEKVKKISRRGNFTKDLKVKDSE